MYHDFVDRLRTAMEERDMTLTELSQASGVGKSDISRYMRGEYIPKQEKCYKLARALGVDPGWLMVGDDEEDPIREAFWKAAEVVRVDPDPQLSSMLKLWKVSSAQAKNVALDVLRGMHDRKE